MVDIDEFWKALGDEAFRGLAQDGLKTYRKQNAFMVFGTQSPADVLRSEISHTILEQCATKVFLPNPHAQARDYVEGFGLTQREFQLVREDPRTRKRREFLVKQGLDLVVVELDPQWPVQRARRAVRPHRDRRVAGPPARRARRAPTPTGSAPFTASAGVSHDPQALRGRHRGGRPHRVARPGPDPIVYDPTAYAKIVQEAETALNQLHQLETQVSQGQALLSSLNTNSGVNGLATVLGQPALRNFLPDIDAFVAAGSDLSKLGSLSGAAGQIRSQFRLYTPAAGDPIGADIEAAGDRVARDLAAGEAISATAQNRLAGLQQLQASLSTTGDARAVLDVQARLQAEQAMIANDQMRLQGLAMTQAAEDRVQRQRDQERMEADRDARMALYKAAFQ